MKKSMKQSTLILILNGASVFLLLFMAFSFFSYRNVNNKIDEANTQRFELTYNANRFMNASAYLTNEVRAYAATGGQEHYDNYWNEVNTLKNRDIGVQNMKDIGITAEEQSMIEEMSALSNTLVPLEEEAMQDVQAGRMDLAIDYVYGEQYSSAIAKINQIKSDFLVKLDGRAVAEINRLFGVRAIISGAFIISLLLVGAMQVLTSLITRRTIMKPIIAIRDEMGEISCGNLSSAFALQPNTSEIGMLTNAVLTTRTELKGYIGSITHLLSEVALGNMDLAVDDDFKGEFVPIQQALHTILDSLNKALEQINLASEQVYSSSSQAASNAQTLSQGAAEQASAVEALSASVTEVSEQVARTADSASNARTCTLQAASQLAIGNQKMKELTEAMADISGASSQIGNIVKTIDDIAFQTNILALNAAVEAARAGEAGKGFAVVADEVRNLAAKSSDAAKGTTELIDNTLKLVQRGAELASDTAEALNLVVDGAQKSTELVEHIADSSVLQANALQQVTQGIEQISSVVQTNAATAEESAAAAQQLSSQADTLKASVSRFRLRKGVY